MNPIERSTCRKLRRLYGQLPGWTSDQAYTKSIFEVGEFAAKLLPFWMETDYLDFQDYLYHRCKFAFGDAGKITLWTLTYYEIPSLGVWLELGWRQDAVAASRDQDGQRKYMLDSGLSALDLLTLA